MRLSRQREMHAENTKFPNSAYYQEASSMKYFKNTEGLKNLMHGDHVIVDLDYECNEREERRAKDQLEKLYGENIKHPEGFHLHFTSVQKNRLMHMEHKAGLLDSYFCDFYEKPFWELFPLDRLVYLSPDAPRMREFNTNDIYVIGGFIDIVVQNKRSSYAKAKQLGIRTASFPISRYGNYM